MPQYRKAEVKKPRGLWPLYGLLMAVAAGAMAYVFAPEVLRFIERRSPQFSIGTLTRDQVLLLIGAVIFFIIVAIAGMVVAIFSPKKKLDTVRDAELRKAKQELVKEEKARRVRRTMIEREIKKQNKRLE